MVFDFLIEYFERVFEAFHWILLKVPFNPQKFSSRFLLDFEKNTYGSLLSLNSPDFHIKHHSVTLRMFGFDTTSFFIGVVVCYGIIFIVENAKRKKRQSAYQKGALKRKQTLSNKKDDASLLQTIVTVINYDMENMDFITRFQFIVCEVGRHYTISENIFNSREWKNLSKTERRGRSRSKSIRRGNSKTKTLLVEAEAEVEVEAERKNEPEITQSRPSNPFLTAITNGIQLKSVESKKSDVKPTEGGISLADITSIQLKKTIPNTEKHLKNISPLMAECLKKRREMGLED